MVADVSLRALGTYQLAILLSRALGFFRDMLVLAILGATALSDDVFFLLGFTDLAMSIVAGGGAVLYLSLRMKDDFFGVYRSAVIFYGIIALLLVAFEIATSAKFGKFIYGPLGYSFTTIVAYKISILGLVVTFPLAASYAVFLHKQKIYLQPSINIIYTIASLLVLLYFYLSHYFSIIVFASLLLGGAALRLLVATCLAMKNSKFEMPKSGNSKNITFFIEMLSSGLAIGVLVAVPFVFRGNLPIFGDGIYSTSAFAFKVNDMVFAILILPITSIVLNKSLVSIKQVIALCGFSLAVPLILVVILHLSVNYIPQISVFLIKLGFKQEVIEFSITAFCFTSLAYTLGMIQVRIGNKVALLALSVLLVLLVRNPILFINTDELSGYFLNMYTSYMVFIIISTILITIPLIRNRKYS